MCMIMCCSVIVAIDIRITMNRIIIIIIVIPMDRRQPSARSVVLVCWLSRVLVVSYSLLVVSY